MLWLVSFLNLCKKAFGKVFPEDNMVGSCVIGTYVLGGIRHSLSCLHSLAYFFWSAVVCLTYRQASAQKNYVRTTESVVVLGSTIP